MCCMNINKAAEDFFNHKVRRQIIANPLVTDIKRLVNQPSKAS